MPKSTHCSFSMHKIYILLMSTIGDGEMVEVIFENRSIPSIYRPFQ